MFWRKYGVSQGFPVVLVSFFTEKVLQLCCSLLVCIFNYAVAYFRMLKSRILWGAAGGIATRITVFLSSTILTAADELDAPRQLVKQLGFMHRVWDPANNPPTILMTGYESYVRSGGAPGTLPENMRDEYMEVLEVSLDQGLYSFFDELLQWTDACIFRGSVLHELGVAGYCRWALLLLLCFFAITTKWAILLLVTWNVTAAVLLLLLCSCSYVGLGRLKKVGCRLVVLVVCCLEAVLVLGLVVSASGVSPFCPSSRFVLHWVWNPLLTVGKFNQMATQAVSELAILLYADGFSVLFIAMSVWVGNICLLSLSELRTSSRMSAAVFFLKAGSIAAFASFGLFSYIVFMEATVLPLLYLLRGGLDFRRGRAGFYYLLYSFLSGLVALSTCAYMVGTGFSTLFCTFGIPVGIKVGHLPTVFICLLVSSLLVKIPVIPFHHWLLSAHVEASTSGSVLLAAILWKLPAVAWVRVLGSFADALPVSTSILLTLAGLTSLLLATARVWFETDFKRLIAYSSIIHIGGIILLMSSSSFVGSQGFLTLTAVLLVAHSLATAALFFCAGAYSGRFHTRDITCIRGMGARLPRLAWSCYWSVFISAGVPLSLVFVGEVALLWFLVSLQLFVLSLLLLVAFSVLFVRFFAIIVEFNSGSSNVGSDASDLSIAEFAAIVFFLSWTILLGFITLLLMGALTRGWRSAEKASRCVFPRRNWSRAVAGMDRARWLVEPIRTRVRPASDKDLATGARRSVLSSLSQNPVCRPAETRETAIKRQLRLLAWRLKLAAGESGDGLLLGGRATARTGDAIAAARASTGVPTGGFPAALADKELFARYAAIAQDPLAATEAVLVGHRASLFSRLLGRWGLSPQTATTRAVWRGLNADRTSTLGSSLAERQARISNSIFWDTLHSPVLSREGRSPRDFQRLLSQTNNRTSFTSWRKTKETSWSPEFLEEERAKWLARYAFFPELGGAAVKVLGETEAAFAGVRWEHALVNPNGPEDPVANWWDLRVRKQGCECPPEELRVKILLRFLEARAMQQDAVAPIVRDRLERALATRKVALETFHSQVCLSPKKRPTVALLCSAPGRIPSGDELGLPETLFSPGDGRLARLYGRWLGACQEILENERWVPERKRVPREFLPEMFYILADIDSAEPISGNIFGPLLHTEKEWKETLNLMSDTWDPSKWPQVPTLEGALSDPSLFVENPEVANHPYSDAYGRLILLRNEYIYDSEMYSRPVSYFLGLKLYGYRYGQPKTKAQRAAGDGVDFESYLALRAWSDIRLEGTEKPKSTVPKKT